MDESDTETLHRGDHQEEYPNLMKPWPKGTSGNPVGPRKSDGYWKLRAKLLTEFGDLTPTEEVLLDRAVTLLIRRPRNDAAAVKLSSEARRCLMQIQVSQGKDNARGRLPSSNLVKEYAKTMKESA